MAASLHGSVLLRNTNPNLYGVRVVAAATSPSSAISFPLAPAPRGLVPARALALLTRKGLGSLPVPAKRKPKGFVALATSHEESRNSDIEVEKDNNDANVNDGGSKEAWKEALERFKVEALKVKAVSEEAYEVYSKKATEMLMDTSEKLKIQADKAQKDLSVIAQEISNEGQEYLSAAAKNYPDSVREVLEVYASVEESSNISTIRDFYLGIPYGCFLAVGGFLHFMLTGSIPAIRFGIILGTANLALSVSSLRAWKNGKETPLLLVGQTAISAIIFFRQWLLCSQRGLFPNLLMLLISLLYAKNIFGPNHLALSNSGAMLGFYVYRLAIDYYNKGENVEQSSEN